MSSTLPPAPGGSPYDPPEPGAPTPPPHATPSPYAAPTPYATPSPYDTPPQPPYGSPSPYPYAPPPAPGTDGLAIASLVTGILSLALIAIGLGIAALQRIKRTGRSGRGLAIAGIILGALGTVGWAVLIWLVVVLFNSDDFRDTFSDAYVDQFNSSTGYEVGVCFDPEASIAKAAEIDCATPHPAEIVGVDLMTHDAYPGDSDADSAAIDFCYSAFADYVGVDYDSSSLDMRYLYPDESSWTLGDRQIVCWVEAVEGELLDAGSVRGTAE